MPDFARRQAGTSPYSVQISMSSPMVSKGNSLGQHKARRMAYPYVRDWRLDVQDLAIGGPDLPPAVGAERNNTPVCL